MSESDFRSPDAREEADLSAERDEQVTGADPGPIDTDDMAAADGLTPSPGTDEHYQEMTSLGANARGEGRMP